MPDVPLNHTTEDYLRTRRFARECATQFLYQTDVQACWDEPIEPRLELFWEQVSLLDNMLEERLLGQAKTMTERLVRGVAAKRSELDAQIGEAATNWRVERMGIVDRNVLRIATYEICHCDDVPDVAAINEAIEIAKEFGHGDSGRFINGILDGLRKRLRKDSK